MGTEAWSAFPVRASLSDNNNPQLVFLDTTLGSGNQNQRISITQVLRSGLNLGDLTNPSTAVTNLGATSANTASALVRRDASGNFSMGTLTAAGATINAGPSGFNITGTNAAVNLGNTPVFNIAEVGGAGSFFTDAVVGDCIIRQTNTSLSMRIGIGSATSQMQLTNTAVNLKVNGFVQTTVNPTFTVGGNFVLAKTTVSGNFFTNAVSGDCIILQSTLANTIRIGIANGSQASALDVSASSINANVNLLCAASLSVGINGTFTGTLSSLSLTTGFVALSTSGGTPANLDYYEQNITGAFTVTIAAPDGANHTVAFRVIRTGHDVRLESDGLSVTSTTSAKFTSANGSIPARWSPVTGIGIIINVINNGVNASGYLQISSAGAITVNADVTGANFTNTGTAAVLAFSVGYVTP